eukprot:gene30449-40463_t
MGFIRLYMLLPLLPNSNMVVTWMWISLRKRDIRYVCRHLMVICESSNVGVAFLEHLKFVLRRDHIVLLAEFTV